MNRYTWKNAELARAYIALQLAMRDLRTVGAYKYVLALEKLAAAILRKDKKIKGA